MCGSRKILQKKSKVHGGDAKNIEVWAEEKAKEMFQTWQTDDEDRYKEQIRVLKESRATEMDKNKKLEKELAEEKTTCADLRKDIDTNDRLHKLEVKNLEQRLEATQKDKEYLQTAFYPRNSSTAPSRRGENASMNHHTPDDPKRSGDSP
jgi:predicted  nucleic acid-binding Zn-ribbon protein